jgi:hypothetical protein
MRIDTTQRREVFAEIKRRFDPNARVWLFGSRADDIRRGGDFDLFVEAGLTPPGGRTLPKIEAVVALERILDDQSVDLIVRFPGDAEQPIHRIAKTTGVLL